MKRVWITTAVAVLLALFHPMGFAAKVVTAPLSEKIVHPRLSAPAEVISYRNSALGSKVAGKVIALIPLVGESVKQGDLLLRIDNTNYRLSLRASQAAKESLQAKIKFSRYQLKQAKRLGSQRNISEELVLQRESELESLMAQLSQQMIAIEQAQHNLEQTSLTAPFAGVVTQRLISEGEWANPGTPLIQLLATDAVEVTAHLHPHDIPILTTATALTFTTTMARYPVMLRTVLPLQDNRQRTQEIRLTFQSESAITGSAGRLEWQDLRPHIPAELLTQREGTLGLFIAQQGRAKFIALPQAQEGQMVLIVELPAETEIVATGRERLQNGDELDIE
ncbi:MAG: efflux RND transporter periplasmic adaptor subunit [Candidatus Polarisedimenticolaceae bacterium]|nr:efflux RND transporter periplasmic adaptor subunit [Candidatus Polarisedimenticolaceae bacterium]